MPEIEIRFGNFKGKKQTLVDTPMINEKVKDPKGNMDEGDTVMSTISETSLDLSLHKYSTVERNAISKHSLGVYYVGKKEWSHALDNLQLALKARKEIYGKKDGHIAETKIYFAEVIAGLGDKEKAIAILQKNKKLIEILRKKEEKKKEEKKKTQIMFTKDGIDLDKLNQLCIEKLEKMGIKTNKFVKKHATTSRPGEDVFGQDYQLMREKQGSLDDPDIFVRVMKTEDLTQEEITKGINGLNNEIQDLEIYVTSDHDEEFADLKVASFVKVFPTKVDFEEDEDAIFGDLVNFDNLTVDSENSNELGSISSEEPEICQKIDNNKLTNKENGSSSGYNQLLHMMTQSSSSEEFKHSDECKQLEVIDENAEIYRIPTFQVDIARSRRVERRRKKLDSIDEILEGNKMLSHGDIMKTEKFFNENIDRWIEILGYENPYVIKVKEDMGDIAYLTGRFKCAKQNYQVALRTTRRLNNDDPCDDTVRLLEKMAMTYSELSELDTANKTYEEATEMSDYLFKFDLEIGSVTCQDFWYHKATINFKTGNYDLARKTLAQSIRVSRQEGLHIDPKVYNLIGIIFFSEKRYSEAKHYFEKAFQAINNVKNFPIRHKIDILYNLGSASNQLAFFEYALQCFNWANQELNAPDHFDFDQKLEQIRIFTNIGHAQFHLKNFEMAYSNYTKAYSMEISLFNEETRLSATDLRRYIGVTRSSQGKYDDALYIFEEILYSQKQVEWTNDTTVGKVLLDIGEIYLVGGSMILSPSYQLQLAASCCKRAIEIFDYKKLRTEHAYVKQAKKLKEMICKKLWGEEYNNLRSKWDEL